MITADAQGLKENGRAANIKLWLAAMHAALVLEDVVGL